MVRVKNTARKHVGGLPPKGIKREVLSPARAPAFKKLRGGTSPAKKEVKQGPKNKRTREAARKYRRRPGVAALQ